MSVFFRVFGDEPENEDYEVPCHLFLSSCWSTNVAVSLETVLSRLSNIMLDSLPIGYPIISAICCHVQPLVSLMVWMAVLNSTMSTRSFI